MTIQQEGSQGFTPSNELVLLIELENGIEMFESANKKQVITQELQEAKVYIRPGNAVRRGNELLQFIELSTGVKGVAHIVPKTVVESILNRN